MRRSPQRPDVTVALFILHTWNFDMFWSSLHSYVAAGLGPRTIVIDNSASREALNDPKARTARCAVVLGSLRTLQLPRGHAVHASSAAGMPSAHIAACCV